MDLHQRLQGFDLFRGLSLSELVILAGLLETRQFGEDGVLCLQGDPADSLFLIESGSVEVVCRVSDETEVQLAIRQQGDSIGEMALVEDERRYATVRCLEPVRTLVLSRKNLHSLIDSHPRLFIKIMMNLVREVSRRLRETDQLCSSALFGRD